MDGQILLNQALQLHREGQLEQAEAAYRQVIELDPTVADAWNGLGVLAQQLGMYDVSVDLIGQAIDLQGQVADYYFNLANSYHALNQAELEQKALLATLELDPTKVAARAHLGDFYFQHQDFQRAVHAYQQILLDDRNQLGIRLSLANCYLEMGDVKNAELEALAVLRSAPEHRPAVMTLSSALLGQRRYVDAIALLQKLVKVDADIEVAKQLACAMKDSGDHEQAAERFEKLIEREPKEVSFCANLGSCYYQLGKFDQATNAYRQAVALSPNPDYYSMLGVIAQRETRWEEAKEYYQQALNLNPDHDLVLNNFANLYVHLRQFGPAFEYYQRAIAINPDSTDYRLNLGVAYYESNQFEKAKEQYRWVLAHKKDGDGQGAHNNLSLVLLLTQAFEEGWQEHNYRPAKIKILTENPDVPFSFSLPDDLTGKRILLWAEQGVGDELFYMRFIPLLKQRGAYVICQVTAKILSLAKRLPGIDEVVERSQRPSADYEVFIGDLPMILRCHSVQDIPPPLPMTALETEVIKVREQLAKAGPPPYIGLTWRGGTSLQRQKYLLGAACARREIELADFAQGIRPLQGTLVALQRIPEQGEIARLEEMVGRPILNCSVLNDDLEAMLALLNELDHYIAVPNTNVYLRCSLGKISEVMLNSRAGWTWLAEGDESSWYPHCKLYRATINDDWASVFAQMRSQIA